MDHTGLREATRALLLGAGALYATASPWMEASACHYCYAVPPQSGPGYVRCSWDNYQGYITCYPTINMDHCSWGAYIFGCGP